MLNLFFILMTLLPPVASEPYCSCLKPEPISMEEIESYDLIVKAEVSEITYNGTEKTLQLSVKEVYKGETEKTEVEVVTNRDSAACGLSVGKGEEWLIFAYERDGEYRTDSCSRSGNLSSPSYLFEKRMAEDLAFLEEIDKGKNPVFPGWYADPEGIIFDDTYWIFPTYSAPYEEQVFFDAFSSPDLVTWTKHSRILDTAAVKWAKKAVWAPSIIKKEDQYFLFFGANDIQSDAEEGGIGVAVASRPEGPYKDHLGKPLIDKFHNGAQPIDQFVFKDVDGQHYLIYGGWGHCNIARLNDDFSGFIPFEDGTTFKEVTPENYVEGPFMFVRDGKYYFMWSEGGWTGPDYSVAYAIADSPLGPFKRIGKILQQDPKIATGAGHHSVIKLPNEDTYYIVYHRRPLGETDRNSRVTAIEKMTFDENGHIQPVVITNEGVEAHPID